MFNRVINVIGVWLILVALSILVSVMSFAYAEDDWGDGWDEFTDVFGGVSSFGALLGIIAIAVIFSLWLWFCFSKDYDGQTAAKTRDVAVTLLLIGGAAVIGIEWVELPNERGVFTVGAAAVLLALSEGITRLARVDF